MNFDKIQQGKEVPYEHIVLNDLLSITNSRTVPILSAYEQLYVLLNRVHILDLGFV